MLPPGGLDYRKGCERHGRMAMHVTSTHGDAPTRGCPTMGRANSHHIHRVEPQQRQAAPPAGGVVEPGQEQGQQPPPHPEHPTVLDITAGREAAAAAEVLSKGRTVANVFELAAKALDLAQRAIEQVLARTPPESRPACRAGCAFCCAIPVAVSPPEALYIAAYMQKTLSPEAQVELHTRLRARVEERQGSTVDAPRAHQRFCSFLRDDRQCGIYPIRPLACRGYNSMSRSACEEVFTDQGNRVHMHAGVRELAAGVIYGLILASKQLGLEWGRYELDAAALRALDTPDAAERWARGERVFAGCDQIAMPPHVAERITALPHVSGS
jgi:Fe-S-cluster containining protein